MKKRLLGIIMMIVSMGIGVYEGIWHLFIQPIMELVQTYNILKFNEVALDVLKILIFFPMLMILVLCLWKIGQMIFLDK